MEVYDKRVNESLQGEPNVKFCFKDNDLKEYAVQLGHNNYM